MSVSLIIITSSGVAYSSRFTMPAPPPQYAPTSDGRLNLNNLWYSYDYGAIHFVMISTGLLAGLCVADDAEHDFLPGSVQYGFVSADLAAVDKSVTPWIVFMGHRFVCDDVPPLICRPIYTSTITDTQVFRQYMADSFEPLFQFGIL